MKAVLISIQPKWCELIASGKKTVEVRKTKPKIETPFKCYIYCTQGKGITDNYRLQNNDLGNSKVIGEFVCDRMQNIFSQSRFWLNEDVLNSACLSREEVWDYSSGADKLYAWHISDLVIYDKPKALYEFQRPCNNDCDNCEYLDVAEVGAYEHTTTVKTCLNIITRPPQSYMYVEELRRGI